MQHRLFNHQDGIIDHNPGQYDKSQHCQHVQRLLDEDIQEGKAANAAGRRNRHCQQDDQRQDKIAKQHHHQQEDHAKGNQNIRLHRLPCCIQRTGRTIK